MSVTGRTTLLVGTVCPPPMKSIMSVRYCKDWYFRVRSLSVQNWENWKDNAYCNTIWNGLLDHFNYLCTSSIYISLQGKGSVTSAAGTIDSGTGFTILSEKKLFLGQKVILVVYDHILWMTSQVLCSNHEITKGSSIKADIFSDAVY